MKKQNNGITLVALVVTIIILLILAGITISQLSGSGLFENAKLAEQKSKEAQEKEDETLADYENKIGEYVDGSRESQTTSVYETIKIMDNGVETTATTQGKIYDLDKSINDYNYLIVYSKDANGHLSSICIDKSLYQIGVYSESHAICIYQDSSWRNSIYFLFPSERQIQIATKTNAGWSEREITLIKGVR